jgi:DNA-binding transcriptional regulator YiaG
MDYAPGIKAVRAKLSLSTQDLAEKCNVSRRTVEGWEQGRMPDAAALNVMAQLLAS